MCDVSYILVHKAEVPGLAPSPMVSEWGRRGPGLEGRPRLCPVALALCVVPGTSAAKHCFQWCVGKLALSFENALSFVVLQISVHKDSPIADCRLPAAWQPAFTVPEAHSWLQHTAAVFSRLFFSRLLVAGSVPVPCDIGSPCGDGRENRVMDRSAFFIDQLSENKSSIPWILLSL